VDDNEFPTSDVDPQSTIDGETTATVDGTEPTVTDQDGHTIFLSYKEYDPGTKLHGTDKSESENDAFMFRNKVGDIF
jgi:hypothetical protein